MAETHPAAVFDTAPSLDDIVGYCLGRPGAEPTYPWGPAELVCKVGGKAFCFIGLESGTVGVKCGRNTDESAMWRDRYPDDVVVSSYIGRYGWNSVNISGAVAPDDLQEMIDGSYDDVVSRLPKSRRPT